MRHLRVPVIILSCLSLVFASTAACAENKWEAMVEKCGTVLGEMQEMPDGGIPEDLLRKCNAIAIFPTTISAGFGIGGRYGQGVIMVRDEKTGQWSPPAVFTLAGGSIGWQIGGQATDIVLLIMTRRSIHALLSGKFKLGADASVAAGPFGRDAEAATDAQLGGILTYSRAKGLFIGLKLEGAVITQHWEGDKEIYGQSVSADEILVKNKVKMPDCAKKVLAILNKYPYKR